MHFTNPSDLCILLKLSRVRSAVNFIHKEDMLVNYVGLFLSKITNMFSFFVHSLILLSLSYAHKQMSRNTSAHKYFCLFTL